MTKSYFSGQLQLYWQLSPFTVKPGQAYPQDSINENVQLSVDSTFEW